PSLHYALPILNPTKLTVLFVIQEQGEEDIGFKPSPQNKRALARMIGITQPRLENCISELVQEGLVVRHPDTRRLKVTVPLKFRHSEQGHRRTVEFLQLSKLEYSWPQL